MMNRRRLLAAGAAAAIGITSPSVAEAAMGARIDSPLDLTWYGVAVTGTISHWDSDAASAVFHTTIVQDGHVAHGISRRYQAGAKAWFARATGATLHTGPATGHATAIITKKDGSQETYKWTVPVVLQ